MAPRQARRWPCRFGLYWGIVRDVDDPARQGRIRVEVHELLGAGTLTNWASYCAPFGRGGAGFFMLARPGNGVGVMFGREEPTMPREHVGIVC